MDDSMDDMIDLQDEIMEEDFDDEAYGAEFEEPDDIDEEIRRQDVDEAPPSSSARLTSRDVDMIGFQVSQTESQNDSSSRVVVAHVPVVEKKKTAQEFAKYMQERKTKSLADREDSELWVDKYAPSSFTQLLSAEKTNRDVLKALKRWDRFVFKRDPLPSSSAKKVAADGTSEEDTQARFYADDGRPRNKVIMLCGPPGTGKTTLAHIAAIHCGYRPVEVNASDDRSPEALKELLARATQNATLDMDKKPNCIIFDEIDGMDGNKKALEMLLDVIKAPLASTKAQAAKKAGKKATKATNGAFSLTRPLICICNDQYSPVLRDLRKLSDIFVFSLPSEARLAQRLKHICLQESIDVARPAVLNELISITGHDIRSTINNLQFAAMKAKDRMVNNSTETAATSQSHPRHMDLAHVISSMMQTGLKDDQLDSYQVWQRIFAAKPPSKTASGLSSAANASSTSKGKAASGDHDEDSQMMLAINAMQDHGDFEHLLDGVHENIIPRPPPPSKFSQQIGLPPPPSVMNTSSAVTVDCVSALVDIFTPKVRPLPMLSLSATEKATLIRVVQAMESCGVSYTPLAVADEREAAEMLGLPVPTTGGFSRNGGGGGQGSFGKKPFGHGPSGGVGKQDTADGGSIFLRDNVVMVLEPNLSLLVRYQQPPGVDELRGRHSSVQSELRNIVYTEQRKFAVAQWEARVTAAREATAAVAAAAASNVRGLIVGPIPDDFEEDEAETAAVAAQIMSSTTTTVATSAVTSAGTSTTVNPWERPGHEAEEAAKRSRGSMSSFLVKRPATAGDVTSSSSATKKLKSANGAVQSTSATNTAATTTSANAAASTVVPHKKPAIAFKFNQGYSNAVRRPVFLRDFIPPSSTTGSSH
eukprot:gene16115-11530_t